MEEGRVPRIIQGQEGGWEGGREGGTRSHISHVLLVLHDTARKIHLKRLHNLQVPLHIITARGRQVGSQAQLLQLCIRHDRHTRRGLALRRRDELVHFANGDAVVDELQQGRARLCPRGGVDVLALKLGRHGVGRGELLLLVGNVERDALGEDHGLGAGCVRGGGGVLSGFEGVGLDGGGGGYMA